MANLFEILDPRQQGSALRPQEDAIDILRANMTHARGEITAISGVAEIKTTAAANHEHRIVEDQSRRTRDLMRQGSDLLGRLRDAHAGGGIFAAFAEY